MRREAPVTSPGPHYPLPYSGEGAWGLGKPLRAITHPLRADVPIFMGAEGPKNVALAAEIADGWLPLYYSPFRQEVYADSLKDRKADFQISQFVICNVDEDLERALTPVKAMLGFYIGGMGAKKRNFHMELMARMGFEAEAHKIQDLFMDGKRAEAIAAVPDQFADEVSLCGSVDRIRDRLGAWRETPVTTPAGSQPGCRSHARHGRDQRLGTDDHGREPTRKRERPMSPRASGSGWGRSYRLAEFFGIEVFIHWTFAALIGFVALSVLAQTGSLAAVGSVLIPLVLAFGCVVLHEYGHALTARFFGIQTRGITLLPIGGIAELQRSPSNPKQELVIALAGPAVNFALAALLIALLWGSNSGQQLLLDGRMDFSVLEWLIRLNLLLGTFNLLPALPMDGGRILRAGLSLKMPALRATRISATVARGIAALMVIFGLGTGRVDDRLHRLLHLDRSPHRTQASRRLEQSERPPAAR